MTTSEPARSPQWARVARGMIRGLLPNALWFWGVCLILGVIAIITLDRYTDGPAFSIISLIRYGLIWYPFSSALVIVAVMLTVHVAAGQTRRSFLIATMITWAGYALANGLIMAAAVAVEARVYAGNGWQHLSTSATALPELVVGLGHYPLIAFAGGISGLLVGLSYHRVGAWATIALPLTCAPAILATALDSAPIALVVIAVSIVLAGIACFGIGRRIPVRTMNAMGVA
ncbi:hypothetical protein [Ruania halotolerans]|uniref:hypothetical protein n=1 Tax=Ruania halotolerans TaxID=2897773 RepID=UPI001E54190C|nr:hypothetical protein [Ruania halotolerans]UFU05213.1 hypothetical protein LQF10_12145 [Ruania halotolerans]